MIRVNQALDSGAARRLEFQPLNQIHRNGTKDDGNRLLGQPVLVCRKAENDRSDAAPMAHIPESARGRHHAASPSLRRTPCRDGLSVGALSHVNGEPAQLHTIVQRSTASWDENDNRVCATA
jgi:hypothetical protein